jgi:recombinase-like zinc beta ribbon protein
VLEDADRRADGKARTVKNPGDLIIETSAGFKPEADLGLFEKCQLIAEERGNCQRGIPRSRDPGRYPLALRIVDLTDGCGHPMYAKTSGNRRLYVCGRYLKSSGLQCEHNYVDGEAALAYVLSQLRQYVWCEGGRDALRSALMKIAQQECESQPRRREEDARTVESRLESLRREEATITRNLARASDNAMFAAIEHELRATQGSIARLTQELNAITKKGSNEDYDPEKKVDAALGVYDFINRVVDDPTKRADVPKLLNILGFRMGLVFCDGVKGRTRKVRVLKGGVIVTGSNELPVQLYGKDADPNGAGRAGDERVSLPGKNPYASETLTSPREGVSFTKVNRGDKIRTCDLLDPNQAL